MSFFPFFSPPYSVWSHTVHYGPIQYLLVLYGSLWSLWYIMALNSFVWSFFVLHGLVWPYRPCLFCNVLFLVPFVSVQSCMVLYCQTLLRMVPYGDTGSVMFNGKHHGLVQSNGPKSLVVLVGSDWSNVFQCSN